MSPSNVDLVLDGVDSQLATSIEVAVCHACHPGRGRSTVVRLTRLRAELERDHAAMQTRAAEVDDLLGRSSAEIVR